MKFALAAFFALFATAATAVEQIESFDSVIRILADGGMEVTETITVTAEGNQIRRGIYRDFPTRYKDRLGNRVNVDFSLLGATRDGEVERTRVERLGNGVRVYLGRADYFLPRGRYEYAITYRTRFQLGFFDGYDELYWNATGLGWDFSILEASATVVLPAPVAEDRLRLAAYTGPEGSQGKQFQVQYQAPDTVQFTTTARLGPRQGLTVAVGFPKGLVPEPSKADAGKRFFRDNRGLLAGVLGVFGLLGFYISAWRRLGKDPQKGIIIPRYEPPEGYSPASLRYIWRMKYDASCMATALVNLAVKGVLSIRQKGGWLGKKFTVHRDSGLTRAASPGEQALYLGLLGRRSQLEFDQKNHSVIRTAMKRHKKALVRDYGKNYFVLNRGTLVVGLVLSLVVFVLMAALSEEVPPAGFVVILALALINILFAIWMKAPTMQGRKMMDQIEGLRLYLGVAERQDLEQRHEPPATFEEFEKMLPYAVALDCANTWVGRFESVIRQMENAGELQQRGWYSGTGNITASGITRSVNALGSSLSSSISSSSSPPGSSSGSGGGGSSGGGGGGGGGGGW